VDRREGAVRQAVVAQEGLFGDAVLADGDRRRMRAHRHELGQVVQRVGRDVLELGGDRRAAGRELVEGGIVVVIDAEMAFGDLAGRAVLVGVEHPDLVAHFVGGGNEEAAELAATEHAENGWRQDHAFSPGDRQRSRSDGWRLMGRSHLPDGRHQRGQRVVVAGDTRFQFVETLSQFLVFDQHLTQSDKGSHYKDTHFDSTRAIQDARSHDGAVFGKDAWQVWRKFEPGEVITFCDDLLFLFLCQHEGKSTGKRSRLRLTA
jgi:hypothetical protein